MYLVSLALKTKKADDQNAAVFIFKHSKHSVHTQPKYHTKMPYCKTFFPLWIRSITMNTPVFPVALLSSLSLPFYSPSGGLCLLLPLSHLFSPPIFTTLPLCAKIKMKISFEKGGRKAEVRWRDVYSPLERGQKRHKSKKKIKLDRQTTI